MERQGEACDDLVPHRLVAETSLFMAKFEIYARKDGEYSWRLKSGNGYAADAKVEQVEDKA